MTNPYYLTYQFRDVMLGNGDELRLKIKITINALGDDTTIIAEDESVFISDIGEKEQVYDFEELLLTPTFYSAVLTAIENGNFQKYFFDEDENIFKDAEKNAFVSLEIKYAGTSSWIEEFSGLIIIDSLAFNPDTTEFNFEAAPDMSLLSETRLYDIDGNPLDPFNYYQQTHDGFYLDNLSASLSNQLMLRSTTNRFTATTIQTLVRIKVTTSENISSGAIIVEVWKNGFTTGNKYQLDSSTGLSLTAFIDISLVVDDYIELKVTTDSSFSPSTLDLTAEIRTQRNIDAGQFFKSLKTILLDCYSLVNPDLTISDLEIEHNWNFYGEWVGPEDPGVTGQASDITIDEIEIDIWPLFFDSSYGIKTVADLLKALAREFVCFTGMLNSNKVFFKKLFLSNNETNITLDDESYYEHEKRYKFNPVSYVKVVVKEAIGGGNYNYFAAHAPTAFHATDIQDKALLIDSLTIGAVWINGYRSTNLRCIREVGSYGNLVHSIIGVSDPDFHYPPLSLVYFVIPDHHDVVPTNKLVADFWYRYKSINKHLRVDPIVAPGNNYNINKNIVFKNRTYQPINRTTRYKDCKTEFDGLVID